MADNKNYYYLRLKEHFFDGDELIILESMPNGYLYSNILLKMYLKSLKREGKLTLSDSIPYSVEVLAKVLRHEKQTVKEALEIFKELGLIEILGNGTLYINDIQNYIGKSTTEADRQREYQRRIQEEIETCEKSNKKSNRKSTPKKELELKPKLNRKLEEDTKENIIVDSANAQTTKYTTDSIEMLCVESLIHSCLELYPNSKVPCTSQEKEKWALEIDKMRRLDGRTEDEIRQALKYAIYDSFWKANIRSAKKFREKFETLLIQSKQKKTGNKQTTEEFINNLREWENQDDKTGIF